MRHITLFTIFLIYSFVSIAQSDPVYDTLVWSDEFEGAGAIDGTKWHHQTLLPNGSSWYNGEIQHYTDREENSSVFQGNLLLTAIKENYTDQGVTKQYTSARLNSKFAFTYGRVEIRAILPTGVGTWPAMWMLGKNIIEPGGFWAAEYGTVNWPDCGEIDIMEHWGANQDYISSAIHTPSSFGNTVNNGGRVIPNVSSNYHIYEMEWSPTKIIFSVDGIVHYTYEPAVQDASTWPFDEAQYILLNTAILPEISPSFTESTMQIDYVRVYQENVLNTNNAVVEDQVLHLLDTVNQTLNLQVPVSLVGSSFTLYSIYGQMIDQKQLLEQENNISIASLSKGTYFFVIQTPEGNFKKKIIL